MSERLRVGIVGAGIIVRDNHLPALGAHPDKFEIVAFADPNREAAEARVAETTGSPAVYASHQELCADDRVDVILVAVPPYLASPVSVECLRSGKHVMTEKPMGNTGEDARALYEASLVAKGHHMVAENFFFQPGHITLRRFAREGSWPFGEPLMLELRQYWRMTPKTIAKYYHSPWRHDDRLTWGYLIEGGCHTANPIREAFGMPRGICSRMLSGDKRLGRFDTLIANAVFEGGTAGQITMCYGFASQTRHLFEVFAEGGTLRVESKRIIAAEDDGDETEIPCENPYGGTNATQNEWLHFYDVVANGAEQEFTSRQSYEDIEFVQRLIDAARVEPARNLTARP